MARILTVAAATQRPRAGACGFAPGLAVLVAVLSIAAQAQVNAPLQMPAYEPPVVLLADDVVPAALRSGKHHQVREHVINDGFVNQYVIDSDFGEFVAESDLMLSVRVGEIDALAELDDLSRTRVFMDAAGNAALSAVTAPIRTVTAVVTRPVRTVTGLPGGVRRMFQRFGRRAKSAVETAGDVAQRTGEVARDMVDGDNGDGEDGASDDGYSAQQARSDATRLADRYFKVSRGERRWAAKLNVDPYTDNEALAQALKEVGRIDRAGDLATSFVPIMPGIRALDYLGMVNDAVWERDAFELNRLNRERLRDEYGLSVNEAEAFLDNDVYTPTMQTVVINALLATRGVPNLKDFIEITTAADTVGEARYHVLTSVMLVWLSRQHDGLGELRASGPVTMIVAADGAAYALMPVDHLSWNEGVDGALAAMTQSLAGWRGTRHLYLTGAASPTARAVIGARGWHLREGLAAEITAGMIGLRRDQSARR